ncbi:hypothetical protein [Ravibacter arvi]
MEKITQSYIMAFILMCASWGCKKADPERNPNDQVISIPDPVFEKALAAYDSDKTINGRVLYDDIKDVETLFISAGVQNPFGGTRDTTMSADDLTGIEYFTNLKSLTVETSKLSSLDLTQNKNLEYLDCSGYYKSEVYYRSLKELKLSASNKLKTLVCDYTWLEELSLEGFPNLERLSFMTSEKLMNVKVNKNPNLINLTGNMLAPPMDLSHNTKLQYLSGMVKIEQQTFKGKPDLLVVGVTAPDGVEELIFCENPKIKTLSVASNTLARVTIPAGIKNENVDIKSLIEPIINRCR